MAWNTSKTDPNFKFWKASPFYDPNNPSRTDVANIFLPQYIDNNEALSVYKQDPDKNKPILSQIFRNWQNSDLNASWNQIEVFKVNRNHTETLDELRYFDENIAWKLDDKGAHMTSLVSSLATIYQQNWPNTPQFPENVTDEEWNKIDQKQWAQFRGISKFLAEKFFVPNRGGYILCGCAIDMCADCKIEPFMSLASLVVSGGDNNNYWYRISEKTKQEVKNQYRIDPEKTSLYKALDRWNDRCLLADTLSKIFFKQPKSAELNGNTSITDDMVNLNTKIKYNVNGKWDTEELGNIINNALTLPNDIPIDKKIVSLLHNINRRIAPTRDSYGDVITPTRDEYNTVLNCVAQVAFTNPNKHNISNFYGNRFSKHKNSKYKLEPNTTVLKISEDSAKGR